MVVLIQYAAAAVAAFLGLTAGTIVSYFAQEELKIGRKFFQIAANGMSSLIFAAILLDFPAAIPLAAGLAFFAVFTFIKPQHRWLYYASSAVFSYSSLNDSRFFAVGSLIFLWGMVISALDYDTHQRFLANGINVLKRYWPFLAISLLLFFLFHGVRIA